VKNIQRFEGILVWQEARSLTNKIYSDSGSRQWAKNYALRDQIRRSSISLLANIAEGFEQLTDAELAHFLSITKASASKVKAQRYVAGDQCYISQGRFYIKMRHGESLIRKLHPIPETATWEARRKTRRRNHEI
jgi:four helix bundle protein